MITKTVTYEDFNGDTRTESFSFHFSENEINLMQLSPKYKDYKFEEKNENGEDNPPVVYTGLVAYLQAMVSLNDYGAVYAFISELVLAAYGVKSDDGKRFVKTESIREDFRASAAYDVLLSELINDETKMAEFVNGLVPKRLIQKAFPNGIPSSAPGIGVR